jgi:hypothetical protein
VTAEQKRYQRIQDNKQFAMDMDQDSFRMFRPGLFDVLVIIGMYLIVVFSSFSAGDNGSFLSRNWQDFIPSLTLVGANILLFYHYGDLFVQGQVSSTIVLLTNGILTQLAV